MRYWPFLRCLLYLRIVPLVTHSSAQPSTTSSSSSGSGSGEGEDGIRQEDVTEKPVEGSVWEEPYQWPKPQELRKVIQPNVGERIAGAQLRADLAAKAVSQLEDDQGYSVPVYVPGVGCVYSDRKDSKRNGNPAFGPPLPSDKGDGDQANVNPKPPRLQSAPLAMPLWLGDSVLGVAGADFAATAWMHQEFLKMPSATKQDVSEGSFTRIIDGTRSTLLQDFALAAWEAEFICLPVVVETCSATGVVQTQGEGFEIDNGGQPSFRILPSDQRLSKVKWERGTPVKPPPPLVPEEEGGPVNQTLPDSFAFFHNDKPLTGEFQIGGTILSTPMTTVAEAAKLAQATRSPLQIKLPAPGGYPYNYVSSRFPRSNDVILLRPWIYFAMQPRRCDTRSNMICPGGWRAEPALPLGIYLSPHTGVLHGSPWVESVERTYRFYCDGRFANTIMINGTMARVLARVPSAALRFAVLEEPQEMAMPLELNINPFSDPHDWEMILWPFKFEWSIFSYFTSSNVTWPSWFDLPSPGAGDWPKRDPAPEFIPVSRLFIRWNFGENGSWLYYVRRVLFVLFGLFEICIYWGWVMLEFIRRCFLPGPAVFVLDWQNIPTSQVLGGFGSARNLVVFINSSLLTVAPYTFIRHCYIQYAMNSTVHILLNFVLSLPKFVAFLFLICRHRNYIAFFVYCSIVWCRCIDLWLTEKCGLPYVFFIIIAVYQTVELRMILDLAGFGILGAAPGIPLEGAIVNLPAVWVYYTRRFRRLDAKRLTSNELPGPEELCSICLERLNVKTTVCQRTRISACSTRVNLSAARRRDRTVVQPILRMKCGHMYHEDCIREWAFHGAEFSSRKCPLCQQDLFGPARSPFSPHEIWQRTLRTRIVRTILSLFGRDIPDIPVDPLEQDIVDEPEMDDGFGEWQGDDEQEQEPEPVGPVLQAVQDGDQVQWMLG